MKWNKWKLGLDTDDLTLAEVLETMPRSNEEKIPKIIRKYENPSSPDALPGAINLDRHDCLHVIFGRGMCVDDEAFIIGVTMGAASDITEDSIEKFIEVSTTKYPNNWRFSEENINSFRLGVGFSIEHLKNANIHMIPFEVDPWQSMRVSEIRDRLHISKHKF